MISPNHRKQIFSISYVTPAKRLQASKASSFLTKPSSWVKLVATLLIFVLGVRAGVKAMFPSVKSAEVKVAQTPAPIVPPVSDTEATVVEFKSDPASSSAVNEESGGNEATPAPISYHQEKPAPFTPDEAKLSTLSVDERLVVSETDGKSLIKSGLTLLQANNVDLSRKAFARAIELEPYLRDGHYLYGYALSLGDNPDFDLAKQELLKSVSIDPMHKESWELIIKIADFTGDSDLSKQANFRLDAIK